MRMVSKAILAMSLAAVTAQADVSWNAPAGTTNDWVVGSNWWYPAHAPTNEWANFSNGGTARINTGDTVTTLGCNLGSGGTGNQLLQTGGSLTFTNWFMISRVGTTTNSFIMTGGTFNKTGPGDLSVGNMWTTDLGKKATWSLSGTGTVANVIGSNVEIGGGGNVGIMNVSDGAVFNQSTVNYEVGVKSDVSQLNVLAGGTLRVKDIWVQIYKGALNVLGGTFIQTNQTLIVGRDVDSLQGMGTMMVSNGVMKLCGTGCRLQVGWMGGRAKGTVTLAGTSLFTLADPINSGAGIDLGYYSTNDNTLTIQDSASAAISNAEVVVGQNRYNAGSGQYYPSTGTLNMKDAASLRMSGWFIIGRDGGRGVMNLNGGTMTKDNIGDLSLGFGSGATGTLNQTAGSLANSGNLVLARDIGSAGTCNFSGGASMAGTLYMGEASNTVATLNMSGAGSLTVGDVWVGRNTAGASGVTNSTINLNGGTFAVNGITRGSNPDPVSVNFNGGVLKGCKDNGNFLNLPSSFLHVLAGGAVFDGGGYALTVGNNLSGAGGLTLQGSGTLTLNGTNTYANGTVINGGALAFGNSNAIPPTGSVIVNAGGAVGYGFTTVQNLLGDSRLVFNGGAVALTAGNAAETINLSGAAFTNTFIGAAGSVTYTGTLIPNGSTYRLGGGGTLTFSKAIAGGTNLVIAGGAGSKVILSGTNTYSGGTLINPGVTLQGSTASLPSSGGGITDNGTLIFDQAVNATFSDAISGSGQVVKQNTGMLTLSGANTYAGPTVINAGGLLVSADGKLGTAPGTPVPGNVTINNATYDANLGYHNGLTYTYTTAGSLLGAIGSFTLDSNRGITIGNALGEVTVSAGNTLTYGGLVTNAAGTAGGLLVSGPGTLAFSGQCLTPGGMQVNNGTVRLGRADALAGNPLAVGVGLAATVDVNGYSQTIGALNGGASAVITNSSATPVTLTVGAGNAAGAFGAAIRQGAGDVSLTKVGTGVLSLNSPSGGNTYRGATTVSAGTLRLGGAAEKWVADTLAVGNGNPVPLWTGSLDGRQAVTYTVAPTLTTNALNGHSVVSFNGTTQCLKADAANSPMSGASDFTLAVVFRANAAGTNGDGNWWTNTGLLDNEQGGDVNDWGFGWNSLQHVGAGRGATSMEIYSTVASALGTPHVAMYSQSGNTTTLLVDGKIYTTVGGGTSARNKYMFAIGSQSNGTGGYFNGDMAEIQIYRTALLGASLSNAWQRLAYTYGITNTFSPLAVDLIPDSSVVNVASNAVLDLNDQSEAVAGLSGAAGASVTLGAGTLTVGGAAAPQTFAGSLSGSGGLVKTGTGVQTLSGVNSYSGTTAVSGGTLLVSGSLYGPVTVGASAAFGAAGTAASLALASGLTINGTLQADVALNGSNDVLNVTGNLVLGADSTLQIVDTNLLAPKIKYTLITYTGTRTGKFKLSNLPSGWAVLYDTDNKRIQVGPPRGSVITVK